MRRFATITAAAGTLLLAGLGTSHAQLGSNDELRATHGAWEVRCVKGTDTCAMSQVGNTKDGKRALLVSIQRVSGPKTDDGAPVEAIMTVQAPLGILLPYGVRIKIDSDKVIPLPLSRCIQAGCVSQAPMLTEAVANMKKGSNAVYGIFLEQEVLVDISLSGFTKAFNSLSPISGN